MRSFIVLAMFAATLADAGWSDYEEVRDLSLDANGVKRISINAGAGSMDITGVDGLDSISVKATIIVPDENENDARKIIEKRMVLTLRKNGDEGQLEAFFDRGLMGSGSDARIKLEISVPQGLALNIDDGAGSMDVVDVMGDVTIDDGSGSIDVRNAGHVKIDDGSGSIDVSGARGDVFIVDGSGSITVDHVGGSVTVDDGSGSIRVSDVENDLVIVDDGSGSLSFSNVRGSVDAET